MKVQLPWLNKASGRSAGTVYQSYWGATYTRSMPALFHYPDTPQQQTTQAKFFDIQRMWIPIYEVLSKSIQKQQRKNKNPYNVMSSFIYKIFHPFAEVQKEKFPKDFGLDRLNRVQPVIVDNILKIVYDQVRFSFNMYRPYNGTSFILTDFNLLMFNVQKQTMMFVQTQFQAGPQEIVLRNTLDWEPDDQVVVYGALSCESWLGNFNKLQE